MTGFKVIGFKEALNLAAYESTFTHLELCYLLVLFVSLVTYSPTNYMTTSIILWVLAFCTIAMLCMLAYGIYMSYNYEAILFPDYVEREQEAIYEYRNGRISKEYLKMRLDCIDDARIHFWNNVENTTCNCYHTKRNLEKTLRKYPEYLQVEFKAYEYFHKNGIDENFHMLLRNAMNSKSKYINDIFN